MKSEQEYKFHALNHFPDLRISLQALEYEANRPKLPGHRPHTAPSKVTTQKGHITAQHTARHVLNSVKKSCLPGATSYVEIVRRQIRSARRRDAHCTNPDNLLKPTINLESKDENAVIFSKKDVSMSEESEKAQVEAVQYKFRQNAFTFNFVGNLEFKIFVENSVGMNLDIEQFDLTLKYVFDLWLSKGEVKILFDLLIGELGGVTTTQLNGPETDHSPYKTKTKEKRLLLRATDFLRHFRFIAEDEKQRKAADRIQPIRRHKTVDGK